MTNLYCVRAQFGKYAQQFLQGNYIAIGWLPDNDLMGIKSRDELYPIYKQEYPHDTSNIVIGQQVGQIARFLLDIKGGDYVILPSEDTDYIYYGIVENDLSYFYESNDPYCPFPHRRKIKWNHERIQRSAFSVPFQNTIRSSLTVFMISHTAHFFETIGKSELVPSGSKIQDSDHYKIVLSRILELDDKEFEILITNLLTALGFEGAEHKGKVGDGGVDATGELNIFNLAKVKIFVQAKRYKLGMKISSKTVKSLRQSIPSNGQGAFITTCDYDKNAKEVAVESGFPRIGLINGNQLVDILVEHWDNIPEDFRDKLGLKRGLVLV